MASAMGQKRARRGAACESTRVAAEARAVKKCAAKPRIANRKRAVFLARKTGRVPSPKIGLRSWPVFRHKIRYRKTG